jgi:hypothetical protein
VPHCCQLQDSTPRKGGPLTKQSPDEEAHQQQQHVQCEQKPTPAVTANSSTSSPTPAAPEVTYKGVTPEMLKYMPTGTWRMTLNTTRLYFG